MSEKMSKLTKKERAWLDKLQAVLDECPSDRIGFYTIGDPEITAYDLKKEKRIDRVMSAWGNNQDFCMVADDCGALFDYSLKFPCCVLSTAG